MSKYWEEDFDRDEEEDFENEEDTFDPSEYEPSEDFSYDYDDSGWQDDGHYDEE
jgi:hypothetical protein